MQRDTAADQELTLKKRARRRLVGAIALVLLMVIVLPMLLKDRSAAEPKEKITITLPSNSTPTEPSDFDSTNVPAEPANTAPNSADLADSESANTANKVIDETKPEPKTDAQVESDPETASTAKEVPVKNVVKEIAKVTNPKDTTSKDASPKNTGPIETSNKKFYVQVGVFSDSANVKQLQAKLSDLGYKSQTEKMTTDKGQKIRLRTQVFGDRNEAAIALENIKDAGLTGMVVSQ